MDFISHTIKVADFFERSVQVPRSKLFLSLIMGLAVVFARVGGVYAAAPQQDDGYITGSIETVEVDAEATSDQLFEQQPPAGSTLTELFGNYELAIGSSSHSFGFGMIAQALWMTEKLHMDGTFFQSILDAKASGDFSQVSLPDGTVPQNWGQLKNAALKGEEDNSLGDVVSNNNNNEPADPEKGHGSNHETPPGQSKDKDDDHGWRKDKSDVPPGQTKDKDLNGNGNQPVTPPGQDKEKGKDKGKDKEKGNSENGKPK